MYIGGNDVEFEEYCNIHLKPLIPKDIKIKLYRWDFDDGGEGIHARYILTERGGMRIDWGLDSGREGQKTDVCLMDDIFCNKRWIDFKETSTTFTLVNTAIITGTKE